MINNKSLIFCLVFLCLYLTGFTQNKWEGTVAYFGEMGLRPGAKVGLNYNYLQKVKSKYKTKKNGVHLQKGRQHQLLLMGSAGGYHHANYLTNLFLSVESGYRLSLWRQKEGKNRKVFFVESTVGAGYLRYFHYGTTFETTSDGFARKELGGGNSFMPTTSFGFGANIPNQKSLPLYWFSKLAYFIEIPQTNFPIMHFAMELGVRVELNFSKNNSTSSK
ncbi:MAG: hypothetical protein AAGJ18_12420 [Bacteroidota bacterium]